MTPVLGPYACGFATAVSLAVALMRYSEGDGMGGTVWLVAAVVFVGLGAGWDWS